MSRPCPTRGCRRIPGNVWLTCLWTLLVPMACSSAPSKAPDGGGRDAAGAGGARPGMGGAGGSAGTGGAKDTTTTGQADAGPDSRAQTDSAPGGAGGGPPATGGQSGQGDGSLLDDLRTHLEPVCTSRPPVVAGPQGLLAPASGVIHCAGQGSDFVGSDFADYWNALPAGRDPAVYMAYWGFKDYGADDARGFVASIAKDLAAHPEFLSVQLGLNMTQANSPDMHYEAEVAAGTLDPQLNALLDALETLARPVYLRIGFEFNGLSWNGYQPDTYRQAFRHVAQVVRARQLEIATVWDAAAAGVSNVMDYYPGDDVVDWWGMNLFLPDELGSALVESFLAGAVSHGKPVMIGESSAASVGTAGGQTSWDGWFAPYFALIAAHPEIMMFCYVNADWTTVPDLPEGPSWGDCRIQESATLVSLYGAEMGNARYQHATDESAHRSRFGITDTQPPGAVVGLRAGNGYAPQILWDCAPTTDGVAGYLIRRDGAQVGRAVQGGFVDPTLRAGQQASYQVMTIDFAGNLGQLSTLLNLSMPDPFQRILNADFQEGLADWSLLLSNDAAATLGTIKDPARGAAARVTITASTGTDWDVAMAQSLTLHAGMSYRIHLAARADAATSATVMLQQIVSPYAVYFSKTIALTQQWQDFTIDAGSDAAEEPSYLTLMLGAAGQHVVDVDDFTLQETAP
jgi:hypothetical protein